MIERYTTNNESISNNVVFGFGGVGAAIAGAKDYLDQKKMLETIKKEGSEDIVELAGKITKKAGSLPDLTYLKELIETGKVQIGKLLHSSGEGLIMGFGVGILLTGFASLFKKSDK